MNLQYIYSSQFNIDFLKRHFDNSLKYLSTLFHIVNLLIRGSQLLSVGGGDSRIIGGGSRVIKKNFGFLFPIFLGGVKVFRPFFGKIKTSRTPFSRHIQ